ncbi:hypothetical protein [Halegenticoccus tardaugens]|uniref:hypothetical protein n=1 Tax=Halegenticoccus tardaugens TaxID=2071624 RepID=UPI001E634FD9|nr:hypothetical protein [Halegenticoccus tardaugens]
MALRLRNRRGAPVDPVPFFVVASLAFLLTLSFGPAYGRALGLSYSAAFGGSVVAFVLLSTLAYYRMIWTARPDLRAEIPAPQRLLRLIYAMIALFFLMLLLALPLL